MYLATMFSAKFFQVVSRAIFLLCLSVSVLAQGLDQDLETERMRKADDPCKLQKSKQVDFTDAKTLDTLTIAVGGGLCSEASVLLRVTQADGNEVYRYQGKLINHLPELIYEPHLGELMSYYVGKALHSALQRTTADLPEYSEVSQYFERTGDFVVISPKYFNELRRENLPILWHKTGESTWVHVIYDPVSGVSEVIMRGETI